MAAGRPCVVSDIDVHREMAGGVGVFSLFPPGDLPALVTSLIRLLAAPDERRVLAEGARARAGTFDTGVMVAAYEHMYSKFIDA
jgi:glycosyltransferase involved in cell wall biosynthesis